MSYFGTQLDELLNRKKMKAVELSRLSGVDPAMISRYRRGDYVALSVEELGRLSEAISSNPIEQAELIRAHLQDQCRGAGSERIRIEIAGEAGALQEPRYQVKLPDELEQCLSVIREWVVKDRNVRGIIEGLGNLLKTGECQPEPLKDAASSALQAAEKEGIRAVKSYARRAGALPPKARPRVPKARQSPSGGGSPAESESK